MDRWVDKIIDCIENEGKRHYLKGVPLDLISAIEYIPDAWYWLDWLKGNNN